MLLLIYLLLFLALCAVLTCCRVASYNRNYRLIPQRAERSRSVPPRQ
jgi:hypothetical protein